MNQRKIAVFLPSLRGGGAERVTLTLVKALTEKGLKIDLVLAKAEGEYISQIPSNVELVDLKQKRVILCLPHLINYLKQQQPRIMISVMDHANIVALWAKLFSREATKLIVSVHNNLSCVVNGNKDVRHRIMPLLAHYFYPSADEIVVVSEGVADDLAKVADLPRHSIHVIYNPVVNSQLQQSARSPLEHPWFAAGELPVILGVGRLTLQKDFPTLIQSFAIARRQLPCRLMILGEGEERQKLEQLIKQLELDEYVSLPGFVDNPFAYMANAAVFVLSSRWEGLPTVLIEAMATGTTVVATDCESGPSEILENGKYGALVPVGDVQRLATAISHTLANPMSQELLQRRAHDFSVEKSLNDYLSLLYSPEPDGDEE